MADPEGLGSQVEATMIALFQQALPQIATNDTPPTMQAILYRAHYSREQPVFPLVEVQFRTGMYRPFAGGGVYSNPPGGAMVPTGAPPALPQQVSQQSPVLGGRIDDSEIDVKISCQLAPQRSLLTSYLRATLFRGVNSSGVPWLQVLAYYGIRLMGAHPDLFDVEDQSSSTENVPQVFTNTLTLIVSTTFVLVQAPTMGDGVTLVETLAIPAGATPPWSG